LNWGLLRNTKPPIIPSTDTSNFRTMKESQSLHLDEKADHGEGLGEHAALFLGFSSVTLQYDGDV